MGPPTTMLAVSSVLLLATVARSQHEGFNIAQPAIHSGVVAFRRDQYRYLRQAYDPGQYAQVQQPQQLQQNSYQVSGAVGPHQQQQYAQPQQGYNQVMQQAAPFELQQMQQPQQQQQVFAAQGNQYAQQSQQQFQPPPAPLSPFLPQQQQQLGSYALSGQQQPQQQYQQQAYAQQPFQNQPQYSSPQHQQQYVMQPIQQQPQNFYQQSPAVQNPFYGQQQQPGGYVQQQQPQFQALPVAQQPQFQPQQQQQYLQAPPPQPLQAPPLQQLQQQPQQAYAQQPFNQPQYSAPQQPQLQQLQRPAAVIAPPPQQQQLPVALARPAPPPDRFAPYVADQRDPAAAVAATAHPPIAFAHVETVAVVAADSHNAEQVVDVSHSRSEARPHLRHKKKKRVKVLPTTVETVTVAAPAPVAAHLASHRIVTTTFPPSFAPPRVQQQRVRPSTLPPAPPPQVVTRPPPARVLKPSNRPSKLVELTTAASAGGFQEPNDVFLQCCQQTGIDPKCHSRCNFDTLTKKVLTGMFLGTDPCPQKNGRNMLECAAQRGDHTPCCMERGVHTTAAKNKCLGFCVMTPGSSFMADISMLPCWAVLNDIKGCFKDAILDQ